MDHRIVAVPFEGDLRELPSQPHIERVVQIRIRRHGRNRRPPVEIAELAQAGGGAWPARNGELWFRIRPGRVTGRRLRPGPVRR
ncbi:hypothetical protein GTZ85_09090 [Streptomyces sp. SID5474]|nr:hypothetical protein [Streptomyces sp. SID5474]